jgi:NAD(P) transhydrogenase subunit beta
MPSNWYRNAQPCRVCQVPWGFIAHWLSRLAGRRSESSLDGFAVAVCRADEAEIATCGSNFSSVSLSVATSTASGDAYGKPSIPSATKAAGGHLLNAGAATGSPSVYLRNFNTGGFAPCSLMTLRTSSIGYRSWASAGYASRRINAQQLPGWAAAAIGFRFANDSLIVVGALCRFLRRTLSYIMQVMNWLFVSVTAVFWRGLQGEQMAVEGEQIARRRRVATQHWNEKLTASSSSPATAWPWHCTQQSVSELRKLRAWVRTMRLRSTRRRIATGAYERCFAEARVPYDIVMGKWTKSTTTSNTDVGYCDRLQRHVNPAAQDDPNSPIAGMPVLECCTSKYLSPSGTGHRVSRYRKPAVLQKKHAGCSTGTLKPRLDALLPKID